MARRLAVGTYGTRKADIFCGVTGTWNGKVLVHRVNDTR